MQKKLIAIIVFCLKKLKLQQGTSYIFKSMLHINSFVRVWISTK